MNHTGILQLYVLTVCQVSANAMFNHHSAYQTSDGQHISRFSVNMLTDILLTSPPKVLSDTWPTEVSTLGLQTGLEWHCIDRNKDQTGPQWNYKMKYMYVL